MNQICSHCGLLLSPEMNFCPRCGKKIKRFPLSTTLSSQIVVYFVSLFLPPFGLWYAYKYLKHGGQKEKIIGYAAIILTVVGAGFLVWATKAFINSVNQSLQELNF